MSDDRERAFFERNENGHVKVRPATDLEWTQAKRVFYRGRKKVPHRLKYQINEITLAMAVGYEETGLSCVLTEADLWLMGKVMETLIVHMPVKPANKPSMEWRDLGLAVRVQQIKGNYPRIKSFKGNREDKKPRGESACEAVARERQLNVGIVERAHDNFHKEAKQEYEMLRQSGMPIHIFDPSSPDAVYPNK